VTPIAMMKEPKSQRGKEAKSQWHSRSDYWWLRGSLTSVAPRGWWWWWCSGIVGDALVNMQ